MVGTSTSVRSTTQNGRTVAAFLSIRSPKGLPNGPRLALDDNFPLAAGLIGSSREAWPPKCETSDDERPR